jgi:hypothetical protein
LKWFRREIASLRRWTFSRRDCRLLEWFVRRNFLILAVERSWARQNRTEIDKRRKREKIKRKRKEKTLTRCMPEGSDSNLFGAPV